MHGRAHTACATLQHHHLLCRRRLKAQPVASPSRLPSSEQSLPPRGPCSRSVLCPELPSLGKIVILVALTFTDLCRLDSQASSSAVSRSASRLPAAVVSKTAPRCSASCRAQSRFDPSSSVPTDKHAPFIFIRNIFRDIPTASLILSIRSHLRRDCSDGSRSPFSIVCSTSPTSHATSASTTLGASGSLLCPSSGFLPRSNLSRACSASFPITAPNRLSQCHSSNVPCLHASRAVVACRSPHATRGNLTC